MVYGVQSLISTCSRYDEMTEWNCAVRLQSLYLCFRLLFGQWSHSKQSSWSSHRVQFFWSSGYDYALIVPICLCISEKIVCTREFIAFWQMKCVSEFVGSLQCLTSSSSVFVKGYHCSICTSVLLLTSLSFRVWVSSLPCSLICYQRRNLYHLIILLPLCSILVDLNWKCEEFLSTDEKIFMKSWSACTPPPPNYAFCAMLEAASIVWDPLLSGFEAMWSLLSKWNCFEAVF